jgi:hypothetical protein
MARQLLLPVRLTEEAVLEAPSLKVVEMRSQKLQ